MDISYWINRLVGGRKETSELLTSLNEFEVITDREMRSLDHVDAYTLRALKASESGGSFIDFEPDPAGYLMGHADAMDAATLALDNITRAFLRLPKRPAKAYKVALAFFGGMHRMYIIHVKAFSEAALKAPLAAAVGRLDATKLPK